MNITLFCLMLQLGACDNPVNRPAEIVKKNTKIDLKYFYKNFNFKLINILAEFNNSSSLSSFSTYYSSIPDYGLYKLTDSTTRLIFDYRLSKDFDSYLWLNLEFAIDTPIVNKLSLSMYQYSSNRGSVAYYEKSFKINFENLKYNLLSDSSIAININGLDLKNNLKYFTQTITNRDNSLNTNSWSYNFSEITNDSEFEFILSK